MAGIKTCKRLWWRRDAWGEVAMMWEVGAAVTIDQRTGIHEPLYPDPGDLWLLKDKRS